MPSWTTDEKTALFNSTDALSDAVTYGLTTIYGEFLNDYQSISLVSGDVMSSGPAFKCAASSVPGVIQGSTLTFAAVSYTVTAVEPDGTGLSILRLRKT